MFQKIHLVLFVSLLTVVFLGCAELQVETPLPVAESPEVNGETWKTHAEVGMNPARRIQVTSNAGARPPSFNNPQSDASIFPFWGLETGLGSRFQVGLGMGLNGLFGSGKGSTSLVRGKFQLIGDPRTTAAKDNLAVAIFGNWGRTGQSNSGDQETTFGGGGSDWSGSIIAHHTIVGASIGYRIAERSLIYTGYGEGRYKVNGDIHQVAAGADPGGTYPFEQTGKASALTLALDYQICQNKKCRVNVKYTNYQFEWDTLGTEYDSVWGGTLVIDIK